MPELVAYVARLARDSGLSIGVAESLTAGRIAAALGAGPDAADWFRGSIVAYAPEVKYDVLGVDPGPVNTARCAGQLATGAVRVLGADLAVAATGVGGPGPDEGVPPGTVFLACANEAGAIEVQELHLPGPPGAVVGATVQAALRLLAQALESQSSRSMSPTAS
ncbi:MAG: CinA family protein [Nocardioidaceae bacterium]|nr:CinA family protein [Nocardioidaceae bacterium]